MPYRFNPITGKLDYYDIASAVWGSITGTLSAQSDLQSALNAKLNIDQTTPQTIIGGIPLLSSDRIMNELNELVDKKYVDEAVTSIGARYYMIDDDDPSGYKLCSLSVPTGAEATYVKSNLNNNDYVFGWISASGERPAKLIAGVYNWHMIVAKTSGTKTLRLYWTLVERKADNSEVVIATSANSNTITSKASYEVPLVLSADYQPDIDSRIVGKIYANVSGSGNNPEVTIYYEGTSTSHWEIPTNTEILQNMFIPYTGATADVNLGSHNITTTGTLGAGAITGTSFTIGANTLDTTEWAFLDGQDQAVKTTSSPSFVRGTFTEATLSPFVITSTAVNTNLNADLLDGSHASAFQPAGTYVTAVTGTSPITSSGGTTPAIGLAGLTTLGTANYLVGVNSGATAWEYKNLLGTTNQIIVTHAAGSVTLSTPQDIHTGASPTFAGLTTTGKISVDFAAATADLLFLRDSTPGTQQFAISRPDLTTYRIYTRSSSNFLLDLTNTSTGMFSFRTKGFLNVGTNNLASAIGHIGADRLYLNSTAYLDGATAGVLAGTGRVSLGQEKRVLTIGTWQDLSANSGGESIIGKNVYTTAADAYKYSNTHAAIGASFLKFDYSGQLEIYSDTGATTADATYTPTLRYTFGLTALTPGSDSTYTLGSATGPLYWSNLYTDAATIGLRTNWSEQINLPVQSAKLPASNPCQIDGGQLRWYALFDATTSESAQWQFIMPATYATTMTLTATLLFAMASTQTGTLTVKFGVSVMAVTAGDAADIETDSFDTVNTGTSTLDNNQTAGYLKSLAITLTNKDSVAAGDLVIIKVARDISGTATGDVELAGIQLSWV